MNKLLILMIAAFISIQSNAQIGLWGITGKGGANGVGSIFKTDPSGNNLVEKFSFHDSTGCFKQETQYDDKIYSGLTLASNNFLYGTTNIGGVNNQGVIFKYDPYQNTYTKLFDFDSLTSGSYPYAALVQASDGNLYGTTTKGGVNNLGVLFQYNIGSNVFTKKIDFDGVGNGENPLGSLMQHSNGKIYGTTYHGGVHWWGVIFEYDITTNVLVNKYDFDYTNHGAYSNGSLIETPDGNLHGTCAYGDSAMQRYGYLYEFNPTTSVYTLDYGFTYVPSPYLPFGGLTLYNDSLLYGTTLAGGGADLGTIYEYNTNTHSFIKKHDFFPGFSDGFSPIGSMFKATNGKLYGMTVRGGDYDSGILFEYDPVTNTNSKKYDFYFYGPSSINPGSNLVEITDTCASLQVSINPAITYPSCGVNNGAVSVIVSGGDAPYTYIWNNGSTTATATGVNAGQHVVQVYDSKGCHSFASANLNSVNGMVVTVDSVKHVSCFGGTDGYIKLNITGQQMPINILWSNGNSSDSIVNLSPGVYDVVVTDASNCSANLSVNILEPNNMTSIFYVAKPQCGLNNGSVNIVVSGGVSPYNYQWSSNAGSVSTTSVINVGADVYSVMVSDGNNCTKSFSVAVSDLSNLATVVQSVTPSSCTALNGSIDITPVYGTAPYSFVWSTGSTNEDLTSLTTGDYYITVTDAAGCSDVKMITVPSDINNNQYTYQPEICLVTVDTTNNSNYIVWKKNITNGIANFKIYRESSVNNAFQFVADVPFGSLSEYTDTVANADIHSWRYRIASVDSCQTEILASYVEHQTIYLNVNYSATTNNLNWNYYDGFTYSKFYISRYDISNGWQLYDSVPGNVNNFIDTAPPVSGLVKYLVEADAPSNCIPELKLPQGFSSRTKSNVKSNNSGVVSSINSLSYIYSVNVFPNPAKSEISILFKEPITTTITIKIMDVLGKELLNQNLNQGNKLTIPLSDLASGLYFLKIQNGNNYMTKKFVKE